MTDTNNDDTTPEPTPRPQTMLRLLGNDDLELAYSEQNVGQLVLGLESLMHKLNDLANIDALDSDAYRYINTERLNIEREIVRREIATHG